jgi:hypothetical protein
LVEICLNIKDYARAKDLKSVFLAPAKNFTSNLCLICPKCLLTFLVDSGFFPNYLSPGVSLFGQRETNSPNIISRASESSCL